MSIRDIQLGTHVCEFDLVDPKDTERTVATIKVARPSNQVDILAEPHTTPWRPVLGPTLKVLEPHFS